MFDYKAKAANPNIHKSANIHSTIIISTVNVFFQEVEREISFRTEQGLYYSYFKHLVEAPSIWEGKESLERDNLTEHLNTINIFKRFNIHEASDIIFYPTLVNQNTLVKTF